MRKHLAFSPLPFALAVFSLIWLISGARMIAAQYPAALALTDGQAEYSLAGQLEALVDPTGELTVEQVSSQAYSAQFQPVPQRKSNFGYTRSAIWFRFRVQNQATRVTDWLLELDEPRLGWVDYYRSNITGVGFEQVATGAYLPFSSREIPYLRVIFRMPISPGEEQIYYLRLRSYTPILFPMRIISSAVYADQSQSLYLGIGVFYGIILILVFYNLFLYYSLRDRTILFLVLCLIFTALNQARLDGFGQQFLWPELENSNWLLIFAFLATIFGIAFTVNFLQLKTNLPAYNHVFGLLLGLLGLGIILIPIFPIDNAFVTLLTLISAAVSLLAALQMLRLGIPASRFYLLAWVGILCATILNTLSLLGFIQATMIQNAITYLGITLMALLLSLALADQINLLKHETEKANQDLVQSERRTTQFLDALPVAVTIQERNRKIRYTNVLAQKILLPDYGGEPDVLDTDLALQKLQENTRYYKAGTDEPYPYSELPVSRALSGKPTEVDDLEIAIGEQRIPLEVKSAPVIDDGGQIEYILTAFQDITVRREMESALLESQARLSGILENASQAILSVGINQQILFYNREAERIFGYSSQEATGIDVERLFPGWLKWVAAETAAVADRLGSTDPRIIDRLEISAVRKSGEQFPAIASISKLYLKGEQTYSIFMRDISEQRQREAYLWESESRFQNLFERSPEGIILATLEGRILHVNQALQDFLGYSEADLFERYLWDLVVPEDQEKSRELFRELSQGKRSYYEGESRFLRKDEKIVWASRTVFVLDNADGKPSFVFALVMDVSERKQAEADLARYQEDLERLVTERTAELVRSQQRLGILSRASQVVNSAGLDPEQIYAAIHMGAAWLMPVELFSIILIDESREQIEEVYLADLDGRQPGGRQLLSGSFVECMLQTGQSLRVDDYFEQDLVVEDCISKFEARSGLSVLLRGSQSVLGALSIKSSQPYNYSRQDQEILESFAAHVAITIDNIRLYQQAQASAIGEERHRLARELHDSVTQMLYSMTLLSGGWGKMSQQGTLKDPAASFQELEGIGLQALKEMRLLIHQLRPPILEEIGLVGALQQRLDLVEQRVNVETRLLTEGELPDLSSFVEEQLYNIAQEALNNALRHSHASEITVRVGYDNGQLGLYVRDNGCGFELEKVSFGIGLHTMQERADSIGAQLRIISQPEIGTSVEVMVAV